MSVRIKYSSDAAFSSPRRQCDLRPILLVLSPELDHVPARKRERGLVGGRVRVVVPDGEIAHAGDRESCDRLRVARLRGRPVPVEVTDTCEDSIDDAWLGANEIRVAGLRPFQGWSFGEDDPCIPERSHICMGVRQVVRHTDESTHFS